MELDEQVRAELRRIPHMQWGQPQADSPSLRLIHTAGCALMLSAWSDGRLSFEEWGKVAEFFEIVAGTALSAREILAAAQKGMDMIVASPESAWPDLVRPGIALGNEEKLFILERCFRTCMADGHFPERERAMLLNIADWLGLPSAAKHAWRAQINAEFASIRAQGLTIEDL